MPFDPRGYEPPQPEPAPEPGRRLSKREEAILLWGMGLLMVAMLLMPISLATLDDALAYMGAG